MSTGPKGISCRKNDIGIGSGNMELWNFPSLVVNLILCNPTLIVQIIELKKLKIMYLLCEQHSNIKYFLIRCYQSSTKQCIWFHFLFFHHPCLLEAPTVITASFCRPNSLILTTWLLSYRCCLYNNHQAKDCIDSFVTHCVRVRTKIWIIVRIL